MTQETNQATALSAWWNETSFAGKDQYQLKETGELVFKPGTKEERVVTTVTADNAEMVLKVLTDKFAEVEAKMKELQTEWDATEDKHKMVGKVERIGTGEDAAG